MTGEEKDRARLAAALEREGGGQVLAFPVRNEPYLRQPSAAAHLGVSVSTLRRYHRLGLPVHRVAGVALYRSSEIDRWVLRQSQG